MKITIATAVSLFGAATKSKLSNPGAAGQPEDQLRAPFEQLLEHMAELCGFSRSSVVAVGESSLSELKTRPDYSVTVDGALVGFIELKAPGKGANPTRFREKHDREQWEKLRSLPNVLYSDGNAFSLWQDGELVDAVVTLRGDVETSGEKLEPAPGLAALFEAFLQVEADSAARPERAGADHGTFMPLSTRRSRRAAGARQRSVDVARDGLAKAALSRRHGRTLCRWICAGGHVRPAHGARQGDPAFKRTPSGSGGADEKQFAHRRGAGASHSQRGESGHAADLPQHSDPRAG